MKKIYDTPKVSVDEILSEDVIMGSPIELPADPFDDFNKGIGGEDKGVY